MSSRCAAVACLCEAAGALLLLHSARLAAAFLSVLMRPDAVPGLLRPWLAAMRDADRALWSGDFDPAAYAATRAQINTLAQLAAMLGRAKPDERLMVFGRELQETLAEVSP